MRLRIALILLVSVLCGTALAADKPLDVRDLMTASQFHATGLDTLKPEQLAAFNAWLAAHDHAAAPTAAAVGVAPAVPVAAAPVVAAPTPAPAAGSAAGTGGFGQEMLTPQARHEPDRIESRILGKFTGWNGRTTFHLENGQVWQQADSGVSDITLQDPQVVIKHLGFGYLLTLPGHSDTVFVRRIH